MPSTSAVSKLQGGDEGQRDRFPGLKPGAGSEGAVGKPLEQDVGVRLEPEHLTQPGGLGQVQPGRWRAHQRAPASRPQRVQAAAGGDPVQPGPDRRASLEPGQAPPGRQQRVLQRVLGVLHRAEDPVAVHLQLAPVGIDELAKRLPIPRLRPGEQVHSRHVTLPSPLSSSSAGRGTPVQTSARMKTGRPPAAQIAGQLPSPSPAPHLVNRMEETMNDSPILNDKRAVVFGAGGSIGAAVARKFGAEGAEVFSPAGPRALSLPSPGRSLSLAAGPATRPSTPSTTARLTSTSTGSLSRLEESTSSSTRPGPASPNTATASPQSTCPWRNLQSPRPF